MSLSIFSSDGQDGTMWRRWLLIFGAALSLGWSLFVTVLMVIDPYSSGFFTPFRQVDITSIKRIYANAGRVRDPRFDGAIFGTSTSIMIEPERIGQATDHRFVLLSIEGALPPVHHFLLDKFVEHRLLNPAIIVLVLDDLWCAPQLSHSGQELPYWLYEGRLLDYAAHILFPETPGAALQRVLIRLGLRRDVRRPDGYEGLPWIESSDRKQAMVSMERPTSDASPSDPFPALDDLKRHVQLLSTHHVILLVFAPVYRNALPVSGSQADLRLLACKMRAASIAQAYPNAAVLDLRVDGDTVGNPDHFVDPQHYDRTLAREVGDAIIARLKVMLLR